MVLALLGESAAEGSANFLLQQSLIANDEVGGSEQVPGIAQPGFEPGS